MSHFYRIKEICIDLGISIPTLRQKIANKELPPLEYPFAMNSRVAGYSASTYQSVINLVNLTNVANLANDMNKNKE